MIGPLLSLLCLTQAPGATGELLFPFPGQVEYALARDVDGDGRSDLVIVGTQRVEGGVERLIRIHPALDAPFVPAYVVESVVHHEMLHAVIPVRIGKKGRPIVHGPDFRAMETRFYGYRRAKEWCRGNIERLLQRMPAASSAASTWSSRRTRPCR